MSEVYIYICVCVCVCVRAHARIRARVRVGGSESFQTGQKMNYCCYCRTRLIDGGRVVSAVIC
jgi:hypothetical protein